MDEVISELLQGYAECQMNQKLAAQAFCNCGNGMNDHGDEGYAGGNVEGNEQVFLQQFQHCISTGLPLKFEQPCCQVHEYVEYL